MGRLLYLEKGPGAGSQPRSGLNVFSTYGNKRRQVVEALL
jgi:hypothetical protein